MANFNILRHKENPDSFKHKSDFSWDKKSNPFRNDTPKKKFPVVKLIFAILLNAGTVGILAYHPFFSLRIVEISGLERSDKSQVSLFTEEFLHRHRWLAFTQKSYFFLDKEELSDVLREKFTFDSVEISTQFPNELHITVAEKIQYIIVDNESQYLLLDTEGNVHEVIRNVGENEWKERRTVTTTLETIETTTSTEDNGLDTTTSALREVTHEIVTKYHIPDFLSLRTKYPQFPILFVERTMFVPKEMSIYVSMHAEEFIVLLKSFPEYTSGDSIDYIEVITPYDILVHGKNGINYKMGTKKYDDLTKQLELIAKVFEAGESVHEYIDVRYENRAYWK